MTALCRRAHRRRPRPPKPRSTSRPTSSSSAAAAAGCPAALFSPLAGRRGDPAGEGAGARRDGPRRRPSGTGCRTTRPMRALGIEDREEDFLRYVARAVAARSPTTPTARRSGSATGSTRRSGRSTRARRRPPSCWPSAARCPTATARRCPTTGPSCPRTRRRPGGVLVPEGARESMSDGGRDGIRTMSAAAERDGVDIRTGAPRAAARRSAGGAVVGVEATQRRTGHAAASARARR